MKNKLNIIIFTITLFLFGLYIFLNKDEFLNLEVKNPFLFIPLILFSLIILFVNGLYTKFLVKNSSINLQFIEWFGLSALNTAGNYIAPFRGGAISNAYYLKHKHKFNYSLFLSMLSGIYIIVFWVSSIFGILIITIDKILNGSFYIQIFIFFVACFAVLTLLLIKSFQISSKNKILNIISNVLTGWNQIRKEKFLILKLIVLTIVNLSMISFMSFFEFQLLGINVSIIKIFIYSIFTSFSILVNITPAGFGIRETFAIYSGYVTGIPVFQVVTVSILDRLINFSVSGLLSIYYYFKLSR